jgi:hypothetical protein
MRDVAPDARTELRHFNAVGLMGWFFQGRVLRKAAIGEGSIQAFESLCPMIAPIDDFVHRYLRLPMGQSLIAVTTW